MKRLIAAMVMAGALTALADARVPIIPAQVEAGSTYELICKGEVVRAYTAAATMEMNFEGDANLSVDPKDYQVVLAAEGQDAASGVDIPSIDQAAFANYACVYSDGKAVGAGERLLLVKCADGSAFKGVDGVCCEIDRAVNQIVSALAKSNAGGKFEGINFAQIPADGQYELVVLDTRLPDGTLSADDTVAFEGVIRPTFVRAWGVMAFGDDGKVTGVNWTPSELGEKAVLKQFDFDPRPFLAAGYAAVLDENGDQVSMLGALAGVRGLTVKTSWMVFPYPKAYVKVIDSPTLKKGDNYADLRTDAQIPDEFKLEATYQFEAFANENEKSVVTAALQGKDVTKGSFNLAMTLAEIGGGSLDPASLTADQGVFLDWYLRNSPFFAWNCDFEVSFNADIRKDTFILAGFYDYLSAWSQYRSKFTMIGDMQLPWIGSSAADDMKAGESFRLLKSYKADTITVNYNEICTKVQEFRCGVYNGEPENYGKTITVKLNLYPNYGRDNESGDVINVGTYEYTFCGPLTVTFNKGPTAPLDEALPTAFATNYDGKAAIKLPVPTYTQPHADLAFVGWSNSVDLVNLVYVPTNTWGTLELWSVWKQAQTAQIAPTGGTDTVAIKVTQEWIDENLPEGAAVAEELEKKNDKGLEIWKTYVLGMNPSGTVEVVATEKKSDDTALVVSTVQAPPPDSGFKVTYSLDKIEKDESVRHEGAEQDTKDIEIPLAVEEGKELPTGYYKMNVFITPVEDGKEQEKVQVKSETTVGVLTVQTEEKLVPVSVPWKSLENIEKDIPINEIVQPQGLTEGDTLSVYDQEKKVYNTFVLENNLWKPSVVYTIDSTGAKKVVDGTAPATVSRGSGMWLNRKETGKPFHLFGQYDKEPASTKIQKPVEEGKSEYNLIAPTGIEDTDLNTIPSLNPGAAGAEDKLMIVNNGVPVYYNYKNGKWGYNRQKVVKIGNIVGVKSERVDEAKVGAGLGLWYISKGGEPEINWQNGEQPAEPVQE